MKIELTIPVNENMGELSPEKLLRFSEIFTQLIRTGGLTGVRGGKTIIHFDADGVFQGVQLDYYPWRKIREK